MKNTTTPEANASAPGWSWCSSPYDDTTYRELLAHVERFQTALKRAEPDWLELVSRSWDWVDAALAEKLARLHLRVRHGRKSNRQWLGRPERAALAPAWRVPYWRREPDELRAVWFSDKNRGSVEVDRVNATVTEQLRRRSRRAWDGQAAA